MRLRLDQMGSPLKMAVRTMSEIDVRLWTDGHDLLRVREEWRGLFHRAQSDNPYLSWEWISTWWRHFGHGKQLFILAAYLDGQLVGVMPLMSSRGDWTTLFRPIISFVGRGPVQPDYMDLLIAADIDRVGVGTALLEGLHKQLQARAFGRLELKWIPEDSPHCDQLVEGLKKIGLKFTVEKTVRSPYILISGSWDSFNESLSRKLKRDLRYARNRIAREKIKTDFHRYSTFTDMRRVFRELVAVYTRRQLNRVGRGLFIGRGRQFLLDVFEQLSAVGMMDAAVLWLNGEVAAFSLNLKTRRTLYYWLVAYNPGYAFASPGKLLIEYLLRSSFVEGYERFDFMRGIEDYKLEWKPEIRSNIEIRAYAHPMLKRVDSRYRFLRSRATLFRQEHSWINPVWIRMSKWLK